MQKKTSLLVFAFVSYLSILDTLSVRNIFRRTPKEYSVEKITKRLEKKGFEQGHREDGKGDTYELKDGSLSIKTNDPKGFLRRYKKSNSKLGRNVALGMGAVAIGVGGYQINKVASGLKAPEAGNTTQANTTSIFTEPAPTPPAAPPGPPETLGPPATPALPNGSPTSPTPITPGSPQYHPSPVTGSHTTDQTGSSGPAPGPTPYLQAPNPVTPPAFYQPGIPLSPPNLIPTKSSLEPPSFA